MPLSETLMDFYLAKCERDKHGIFRDHNCWKCKSGEYACVNGNPRQCEFPHARND